MTSTDPPPGFQLYGDFLSPGEHRLLLQFLSTLPFQRVKMRGRFIRREIISYGLAFGVNFQSFIQAPAMPPEIELLRWQAAGMAGQLACEFDQVLVQRYTPNAGIGWHRDADAFGSPIIGVSLGARARMKFRRLPNCVTTLEIPPGSLYVLHGSSRYDWQHTIAPVSAERYSVTFRKLKAPAGAIAE